MNRILIEPHYLGSLEYFTAIGQAECIVLDVHSAFQKQSFRNRCTVLSANGLLNLSIPVHYKSGTPLKEVTIDYNQSWLRQHYGAIYSGYGKSPFYDYYIDYYRKVWEARHNYLIDLNHEMLSVSLQLLSWQIDVLLGEDESASIDLRNVISAKKPFSTRMIYRPVAYPQNFGNTFVPSLSILDLLFCQGPQAGEILKRAVQIPIERFTN